MRKSMKKLFTILFVLMLACKLFAVDGVVTFVKGKVEVKRGSNWVALKVGDKVSQSEIINTGFQSEAKVKLMSNILYLGPVTRVTLSDLSSNSDRDKVNVYLSTGTLRSKVNRTDTKRVSYTVRTPIAVASVRGTDLTFYGTGKMTVSSGIVAVTNEERLAKPKKSNTKEKDKGKEKDKDKDVTEAADTVNENNVGENAPEPQKTRDEIVQENLDDMMNTEGMPGGAYYVTNGMNIEFPTGGGTAFDTQNDAQQQIADVASKVSSAATKEASKSDAPVAPVPVVEEEVVVPTTGTLAITVTIPVEAK